MSRVCDLRGGTIDACFGLNGSDGAHGGQTKSSFRWLEGSTSHSWALRFGKSEDRIMDRQIGRWDRLEETRFHWTGYVESQRGGFLAKIGCRFDFSRPILALTQLRGTRFRDRRCGRCGEAPLEISRNGRRDKLPLFLAVSYHLSFLPWDVLDKKPRCSRDGGTRRRKAPPQHLQHGMVRCR